jgi:putative GTP pyrophosphokinase
MGFATPKHSRTQVDRAGAAICAEGEVNLGELVRAYDVVSNWRASHAYPINTFQATLRAKLKAIEPEALVAQRLKRLPSIVAKLRRFKSMHLSRMQDIGGLRAVTSSVARVRRLEIAYKQATFAHEQVSLKDYIQHPKADGYRSLHLVYRYRSDIASAYSGLLIELQLRTRLQHAWATAVETMGTFLGQALKSGQGDTAWRTFFKLSAAALALLENCPPVPGFETMSRKATFQAVAEAERQMKVLERLRGFSIAADHITTEKGRGAYHLVILDSQAKAVSIRPFSQDRLEEATREYTELEKRAQAGERIEAVLVSAGPIERLRRAYPNYFLDTQGFINQIQRVIAEA